MFPQAGRRPFVYRTIALLTLAYVVLFLSGCGGTAGSLNNTPPTMPTSSGTGSGGTGSGGTGSGGTGSGGSGSGSSGPGSVNPDTNFQASLIGQQDRKVHGSITADADGATGNGTFQFSGQAANTSYSLRVCDSPANPNCPELVTGITDASGNGSGSFHIVDVSMGPPYQTGEFVIDINGSYVLLAAWSVTDSTSIYSTPLFQSWDSSGTVDPLTRGRADTKGSNLHLTIAGALPNMSYSVFMSLKLGTAGGAAPIGNFTTDNSGNADLTLTMPASGYGILITRASNVEFTYGIRTRP